MCLSLGSQDGKEVPFRFSSSVFYHSPGFLSFHMCSPLSRAVAVWLSLLTHNARPHPSKLAVSQDRVTCVLGGARRQLSFVGPPSPCQSFCVQAAM